MYIHALVQLHTLLHVYTLPVTICSVHAKYTAKKHLLVHCKQNLCRQQLLVGKINML